MTAPDAQARPDRWLGWMFAVAALLCPLSLAVPHAGGYHAWGIVGVGAVGVLVALWLLLAPRRPHAALLHATVALGSLLTGAMIASTDGLPNSASLFFIWIVLYAFYVFGLGPAIAHLALVLAVYVACAVLIPAPYPLGAHSIGIAGALIGSGVIVAALKRQVSTLMDALAQTARTDELTQLPNRRAFNDGLERELARLRRIGTWLTLATLDLDNFKEVNDRLGHPAGDSTLVRAAQAIAGSVREVDLATRIGGEEFGVLLPGADTPAATEIAERIRSRIAGTFADDAVPVTVSIGLATISRASAVDATELQRRADRALYAAKANGRDRVERFGDPARAAAV